VKVYFEEEFKMVNVNGKRKGIHLFDVFNYSLMSLLAFITIFPFYYVVIISLADFNNISKQLIYILPTSINFEAYKVIMKGDNILNAFLVSVFVTVIGTAFNMFLSVTAA
jgi:putative aldouronate transport system permease protein